MKDNEREEIKDKSKKVITQDDIDKNQIINFLSFLNFEIDVIKINLVQILNRSDKLKFKPISEQDTKTTLDNLTNFGQWIIELLIKTVEDLPQNKDKGAK